MGINNLQARLEGGVEVVTLSDGSAISFRHPTREQISAAMGKAGFDMTNINKAQETGVIDVEAMKDTGRMPVVYENLGGYCIKDVQPRPELPAGAAFRGRDSLGLRCLTEAALDALDPYVERLGEYLLEQSNLSDAEGED